MFGRKLRNNMIITHEPFCLIFVICLIVVVCFRFFVIVGDMYYLHQLFGSKFAIIIWIFAQTLGPWRFNSGSLSNWHLYFGNSKGVRLGYHLGWASCYNFCCVFWGILMCFGGLYGLWVHTHTHLQRAMFVRVGV